MTENELRHYGVLGMKWGVRKDVPSAGGIKRKKNTSSSNNQSGEEETKKKGLSDNQKRAIKIGAAAVVTGLAIYGGYKLNKHLGVKKNTELAKLTELELFEKLKTVNPNHTTNPANKLFKGTNMNCGQTTIAEELIMRGQNVHAKLNENGMFPEQVGSYFKGLRSDSISTMRLGDFGDSKNLSINDLKGTTRGKKVRDKMAKHVLDNFPDGARGNVYVPNINGNHFISFESVKGKVRFDNPQNPVYDLDQFFQTVVTKGTPGADRYGIRFTRLDDLKINLDNIKEVVTTSKSDHSLDFETDIIKGNNFVLKMK